MIPAINIDTILSDPLLIVASVLLVVSPVVFLVALVKFLRAPKRAAPFAIPHEEDLSSPVTSLAAPETAPEPVAPPPPPPPAKPAPATPPPPAPAAAAPAPSVPADADKTIVLPAGVAEVQAQLEIALTQIRTLNKKVFDLESALSSLIRSGGSNAGTHPDLIAKLQTLAEHVIVLEKEVARLKSQGGGEPPAAERRPPIPL